jgi:hypothetical protein
MTKLLFANIPTMICLVFSGYLCIHEIDGWGWFLAIGLLMFHVNLKDEEKRDEQ